MFVSPSLSQFGEVLNNAVSLQNKCSCISLLVSAMTSFVLVTASLIICHALFLHVLADGCFDQMLSLHMPLENGRTSAGTCLQEEEAVKGVSS